MRVLRLPLVAELADRPPLALRDEDRVEAEATAARRRLGDPPGECPGASDLLPVRRQGHELRHVARAAPVALDAAQLPQRPPHLVTRGAARGVDARPASEPLDLQTGILAENPGVGRRVRPAEASLQERVVVVGLTVLGRVVVRGERLDRPALEQPFELACLARIGRGQYRSQTSLQRTSTTSSTSAMRAMITGVR